MARQRDRDGELEEDLLKELSGDEVEDTTEKAAMPQGTSQTNAASASSEMKTLTLAILKLTERLTNTENPSVKETQAASKRAAEQTGDNEIPAKRQRSASLPSEAIQDGEGDCNEMIDRILNAGQDHDDKQGPDEEASSDDEALMELIKEYDSEDVPGESLRSEQLAKLVNKMFRTQMADQAVKDKLSRQTRPANCEFAVATRVNPGIWRKLREFTKKRDLQLYRLQQSLVKAIIPVARLVDISMSAKTLDSEKTQDIKRIGLEALSLLTHVNYELNTHRKMAMKPDIGKDYAALCSAELPFTDMLFGDDLQKHLKDIGDVNKIGAKFPGRPSSSNSGNFSHGSRPFQGPRQSKNYRGQYNKPWRGKSNRNKHATAQGR